MLILLKVSIVFSVLVLLFLYALARNKNVYRLELEALCYGVSVGCVTVVLSCLIGIFIFFGETL